MPKHVGGVWHRSITVERSGGSPLNGMPLIRPHIGGKLNGLVQLPFKRKLAPEQAPAGCRLLDVVGGLVRGLLACWLA
jgi:hypothetical protein